MPSTTRTAAALIATVVVLSPLVCRAEGMAPTPPVAAQEAEVVLEVDAIGFDNHRGHAIAKLYRPGDNVLAPGSYRRVKVEIRGGEAQLRFEDVPEGTYALVVFHDENDNGEIDHNFLHIPKEQLGFSRGFRPGVIAGMSSFEKLAFELRHPADGAPVVVQIEVR